MLLPTKLAADGRGDTVNDEAEYSALAMVRPSETNVPVPIRVRYRARRA